MRVLACAYACNPYHGSEEGVGWGWVNAIARNHEIWVLTAGYHRRDIEEAMRRQPEKWNRLHFAYVEEKPWHYRPTRIWIKIENSIMKPVMNWAYRSWLRSAFILGSQLHREIEFDLVHQLTYVGFRFPGHLWKLDIPFVWGPIGGLENTPWQLLPSIGVRGSLYYAARNAVNSLQRSVLRSPRLAFAKAGYGVIAATSAIQEEITKCYRVPSHVICEVGTPEGAAAKYTERAAGEPFRLGWSGRHLPGKALHLLLRALGDLPKSIDWRLHIYGDGPSRPRWRKLAAQLGIDERCIWHGHVPRDEAIRGLHDSHLFIITSLKDLSSTVILEALAQGVPVVCPDHCGFRDVVDESCGVRLPIGKIVAFEQALADVIADLAADESMRRRLAAGALKRAPQFSWEVKAKTIDDVYRRTIGAFAAQSA